MTKEISQLGLSAASDELRRQMSGWEFNGSDVIKLEPIIRKYLQYHESQTTQSTS